MLISLLPDEYRVKLDDAGPEWVGLVALVRPLDTAELGKWADAFPTTEAMRTAMVAIVKQQLRGIEGASIGADDAGAIPFDAKIDEHFRAVFSAARGGAKAIRLIYEGLLDRATIKEETEKNSASPSASDGTSGSES